MRLKLLSPGEMNESQRQTYDESIAGKRGKPPAPMMAWLNSPDMARHATRLGEVLRYDTIFPAKLSEIGKPWAASRMVSSLPSGRQVKTRASGSKRTATLRWAKHFPI